MEKNDTFCELHMQIHHAINEMIKLRDLRYPYVCSLINFFSLRCQTVKKQSWTTDKV